MLFKADVLKIWAAVWVWLSVFWISKLFAILGLNMV